MKAPGFLRGIVLLAGVGLAAPAAAGGPSEGEARAAQVAAPGPAPAPAYDEDLDLDPAEPDFEVVNLPTNLGMPKHRLAFRLTHRFARALDEGDFSDLLADLFGFDGGAQIGLGLRFGLFRGTQLGLYRTSDRTIQLEVRQALLREGQSPVGLSLAASIEGLNNFGLTDWPPGAEPLHDFSPSLRLVVSRTLGSRGAVYVAPSWVGNTRVVPSAPGDEDGTLVLGLGVRLRVFGSMALVGEVHPRLAGYAGDLGSGDPDPLATIGVEWRVGGHAFQINFSNTLGTTPAQVARGAQGLDGWFIGFNLTRKFF
ncbi:MAG TPA: DUF5777 family beta-barrel protein [Vicinamibacteria bacterium]